MSRVLLFVQTGDARPKCVKQFGEDKARGLQYLGHLVRPESGRWLYWLVECRNAADGRMCVEASEASTKYGPGPSVHFDLWDGVSKRHGHILASGGRK